jgi:dTDP-glucose 4,6-dehydratase
MNIFVVGGAGFIGSAFIRHIYSLDKYNILNYDLLTYAANPSALIQIQNGLNYSLVHGDIIDFEKLSVNLCKFEPNVVINFAAETHVDRSISNPLNFINTNVLGTTTLLRACSKYLSENKKIIKNFKYIQVSTDEVFGDLEMGQPAFTEKSVISPSSPYSASKASADLIIKAWMRTYNFPAIITHCSNNFGPFQHSEKFIPTIIRSIVNNEPIPIYGDGKQIRDWLYVEDHVKALTAIFEMASVGSTYNIGGDNERTNLDLVNTLIKIVLDQSKEYSEFTEEKILRNNLIKHIADRPGHDIRYAVNSSKLQNELGWKPSSDFEGNLAKTVEWFLQGTSELNS